jgi:hypothetical protein
MVDSSRRRQFDLLNVFEWMLLVGLFFAALAGGRSELEVNYVFAQMPADDSELEQWYVDETGLSNVEVTRADKGIIVRVQQSPLSSFADLPDAPFDLLGYKGLSTVSFGQSTTFLGMPTLSLVIGVALLFAIRLVRRQTAG